MRSILCFPLLAAPLLLPGCFGGVRVLGVGVGVGIRSAEEGVAPELELHGLRIDEHRIDLEIAADLTWDATVTTERTIESPAGVRHGQRAVITHDPGTQSVEVLEAHVVRPDGSRLEVGPEMVFTRPSQATQESPGFASSLTTTVLFPQLAVGSQTLVRWRIRDRGTPALGFNYFYRPELTLSARRVQLQLSYPRELELRWAERGGFAVDESASGGRRALTATLSAYPGQRPERKMVAPRDVVPCFVATSLTSWEEIGARFHAAAKDRVAVTPAIEALAEQVAGSLAGVEAARALHAWLCRNVHYVAVYLNAARSWVPNRADEVLRNGFGDCKDQCVLLAALLQARGIRAELALIQSGRSFQPLPICSPYQFDHCILYLPDLDLFANPTNPFASLGELGAPLADQLAVLATPEGRQLRTPAGNHTQNTYTVQHDLRIESDGSLAGSSTMSFEGRASSHVRRLLAEAADATTAAEDLLMWTPQGGTGALESSDPTDLATPLRCRGVWRREKAFAMGDQVYFPTPIGIDFANPVKVRNFLSEAQRRFPIVISAMQLSWIYVMELPPGYSVERLPQGCTQQSAAGIYTSGYRVDESGRVVIERFLRIERDVFGPGEYGDLHRLLIALEGDVRDVLVLVRAAGE